MLNLPPENRPNALLRSENPTLPAQTSQAFQFSADAMDSLSPSERVKFEHFGQGPKADLPHHCIHHAIEAQAAARPNAIAAEHQRQTITYRELERQANRLAAILTQSGVDVGDSVAVFLHRSIPMLVGILGALKAGAAYVPQHVGVAPESHLKHVIETASIRVILTLSSLRHLVPVPDDCICIAIDELMHKPFAHDFEYLRPIPQAVDVRGESTCYILFTSGTTGTPNGVQVTHGNVCSLLLTAPGDLGIRPGMRVGQILSIAFDMAAWEILNCLSHGATLVIRGKDISETVERVDVVIATPSVLASVDVDMCRNVKIVAVAGEPCPKPLADAWGSFCTFYNSCGPTEVTIVNTVQHYLPADGRLTIGKPTPNNTVYILDDRLQPLPIGEVGEMWAGGDCVSAGYLHNDRLNQERYKPDPFLGGERVMFRTRDLGRWTADGELEHFGRTDDQVKVRGFRVELDAVSAMLESTPSCRRAVTLKYDSRHLVAFVSPASSDIAAATRAVADGLPYYCVPAAVIAMEEFPITSRGKVDKRALMAIADEHLKNQLKDQPPEQLKDQPGADSEPATADAPLPATAEKVAC